MDIVADLAIPLPLTVIGTMLGVPRADHVQVKAWASALGGIADLDPTPEGLERAIRDWRRSALMRGAHRHAPAPTWEESVRGTGDRRGGRRPAVHLNWYICQVLLIAGHETTTGLLGNAVQLLLAHPDVLEAVRQTPHMLPGFIEEVLRYDSPVQVRTRLATQELPLGGQRVAAGQALLLLVGAATATRVCSGTRTVSISGGRPTTIWPSAKDPTIAWAPLWHAWRAGWPEILLEKLPKLALAPGAQLCRPPNLACGAGSRCRSCSRRRCRHFPVRPLTL